MFTAQTDPNSIKGTDVQDGIDGTQEKKAENVWNAAVPDVIHRPQRGEAARYPQDVIIGVLGRGEAPEDAYILARGLLTALAADNKTAPVISAMDKTLFESLFTRIKPINPRKFRIGGGREEADGGVSFLVRFIGRDEWISGELYLKLEAGEQSETAVWQVDDLVLEEIQDITASKAPYPYEFSPYERFF
ncbi:MAG: hypothetical protein LBQ88_16165 [Treponema sp.]|nr:hypothetical protein [Treponema sp.]